MYEQKNHQYVIWDSETWIAIDSTLNYMLDSIQLLHMYLNICLWTIIRSHPDPSCLDLRQNFHVTRQRRSNLKIEADKKFIRQ